MGVPPREIDSLEEGVWEFTRDILASFQLEEKAPPGEVWALSRQHQLVFYGILLSAALYAAVLTDGALGCFPGEVITSCKDIFMWQLS